LKSSPYKVTRIGWGYFTIDITIVLKPGYLWRMGKSRSLKLEWELDFDGFGSSVSYDYAVTVEKSNVLN
jgi:transcription initiation factor IIF auxiliary subunit